MYNARAQPCSVLIAINSCTKRAKTHKNQGHKTGKKNNAKQSKKAKQSRAKLKIKFQK